MTIGLRVPHYAGKMFRSPWYMELNENLSIHWMDNMKRCALGFDK